ncbi:MAG: GntR family transcriptional regulator [Chloroflexi bacterium]|nr:GntR family transcriptional regulator [Chloroflexota bacterium]
MKDITKTAVPRYVQIADSLLQQIESGELAPGDRLASERELSETWEVSRMTLRAALQSLESQGLLERRQGAGTFVAAPKYERQAGKLVPFTEAMRKRGYKTGAQIIMNEQRSATASIAQKLQISTGAPVYVIHRVRLINDEPVLLEKFTMSGVQFPDLESHDLENRSIYEIARTEYGIIASEAQQSLEPVLATEYEAELLGIESGVPLMLERRLAFDQEKRPFEYGHDLYRGDRFRFITEIAPLDDR